MYPGPLHAHWIDAAEAKGFTLIDRVWDRLHVLLECKACGSQDVVRVSVLMGCQPICHACKTDRWQDAAEAAGLEYLRRDAHDRHYGIFRAPCGHELRRQFGLIERMAQGGTGVRCGICQAETEAAEAGRRCWQLVGPDPEDDPNYRLYRHSCGHEQRVARVNMQTGRFQCGKCGSAWPAAPNNLYALRFVLDDGTTVVKLGHSNDPESRLHHQLRLRGDLPAELLKTVPMASGSTALRIEKRLHATLRRRFPWAVLPAERFRGVIKVTTEVYDGRLEPIVLAALDAIEARARRRRD
ncbi:GIY-YIG nuclease family protein [Cereibacter sediminicola]|uniref:GIY-YIG nuclease family protein n=1 Tax=Cereibacter sediminicola TaxID=2584941 RepID=UPI0011A3C888|nr:GIY-YIG nuclease family protein [Cereibacter sediminicola]